jgi:uroporphyrinogen-III synthase
MSSPLAGKTVVVTRALHQADELNALLRERAAVPLAYPCIDFAPPLDTTALDQRLGEALAGAYDWLVFTSSNAVRLVSERLPASRSYRFRIAAVGEATAAATRDCLGVEADLIPQAYNAEAEALAALAGGARVLLPQSELARTTLYDRLTAAGAVVTPITAYRTIIGSGGVEVPALVRRGKVDAITFTSPSTVEHFVRRLTHEGGFRDDVDGLCIACLGATTARAAEGHQFKVSVVPVTQTMRSMCESLEQYFERL